MRIRKRQVPLPFSSLSPLPLSDPLLPPVQLRRSPAADPPNYLHLSSHHSAAASTSEKDESPDDSRETSVFGAETSNGVLPQSTSLHQVVGRWGEREKTFPLKKRRGSFERPSDDQNNTKNNEDQAAAATTTVKPPDQKKTMKTKMNKKCTLPQKQEQSEDHESKPSLGLAGKKRSRGGMLMEGSRCSRVNGRGWRCCQQTLVGYSLCEHHLGKGRLRSMNSVRSRSLATTAALKSGIVVDQDDRKKSSPSPSPSPSPTLPSSTVTSKKKMKLGVVKARSISSLLGQTDSVMAAPAPAPPALPDDNIGE